MHHQNGEVRQQLQSVVPVRDPVQGVGHGSVKAQTRGGLGAVDGIGGARQSTGTQGALVQPFRAVLQPGDIPGKHLGVGHEVLGKGDGLRPLEVGVPRHNGVLILPRLPAQHPLQLQQLTDDHRDLPSDIHPEIQGHLVVAGPGGMEPLARVADPGGEQRLDVHMDILVVGSEFHAPRLDIPEDAA